jgi:serine/threonine protein kinase
MNRSTWQRAKEIFDEARGLPAGERVRFVDQSCAENNELRNQVHELLASYESDFLADTVLGAAEVLVGRVLHDGTEIGRYEIREMIGSGGMGQVFLADDTELNRPVAFKVLHHDVADDKERIRRFIQEAKAASALNHPNILTIHEIGSFEGARFIVSEFVDGETLRDRMRSGLTVAESVEIICQVATALQAAHSAGIVHRDIKPENVMIRRDGLVKVLDFGLAKLTEADDLPIDPNAPLSRTHTSPGLVMGTVAYMSPEQARGQAVDSRTDLWSLGIVFHEMLTGRSPFDGVSATDLMTSILSSDNTPADFDSLPPELTPICKKALTKEREKRYQSAHDLLEDLKGEKKRMEYVIQPSPFISTSNTDELRTQLIRPRPTLSAEYIVTSVKRHKLATFTTLFAVTFLAIGLSVYQYYGAPQAGGSDGGILPVFGSSTTEADLTLSRFASSGKMAQIAISPDGKYVAYVTSDGPGKNALRVRRRETSTDIEIVPAPEKGRLEDLSFSPDSSQVYYHHQTLTAGDNTINRVPVAGGTSTKIIVDVESGGSVSPDGKLIAFTREIERNPQVGGGDDLVVANADGSNERILVHSPFVGPVWVTCGPVPAWSPDGKTLACATSYRPQEGGYERITFVNVADGSIQQREEKWSDITGSVYIPDGSLIITGKLASSERLAPLQLWLIAPNAAPKSLTSDLTGYSTLSATRKGDVLVTIRNTVMRDLWGLTGTETPRIKQITTSGEIAGGFNWTPDGRILFSSGISGAPDIWIMDGDGGNRRQITANHGANSWPSMSPDGRYIIFLSRVNCCDHKVFRMDADGKNLKQLTFGWQARTPRISLDGKWVYYIEASKEHETFTENVPMRIYKVSIDGGEPLMLVTLKGSSRYLDISRKDGRIVYEDVSADDKARRMATVMSPDGSSAKELELPATKDPAAPLRWTPDGRSLVFNDAVKNGFPTALGSIPADRKGSAKQFLSFPGGIGLFEWSKDGKQLAYLMQATMSDAVLITNKGN